MLRLLLNRPGVFFAVITLGLGVFGAAGLLGSRYGPQLVPAGAVGFAYGVTLGVFVAATFFFLRRSGGRGVKPKIVGLVGSLAIIGLFLVIAH